METTCITFTYSSNTPLSLVSPQWLMFYINRDYPVPRGSLLPPVLKQGMLFRSPTDPTVSNHWRKHKVLSNTREFTHLSHLFFIHHWHNALYFQQSDASNMYMHGTYWITITMLMLPTEMGVMLPLGGAAIVMTSLQCWSHGIGPLDQRSWWCICQSVAAYLLPPPPKEEVLVGVNKLMPGA